MLNKAAIMAEKPNPGMPSEQDVEQGGHHGREAESRNSYSYLLGVVLNELD
jgi:hypothetical protein